MIRAGALCFNVSNSRLVNKNGAEVIDGKLPFDAVLRKFPLLANDGGVVDEHVEFRELHQVTLHQIANRTLRRQVREEQSQPVDRRYRFEVGQGFFAAFAISADENDLHPGLRQAADSFAADARIGPRDHCNLVF